MSGAQVHLLDTPPGPARVHLWCPLRARGVLALGHGAGPSLTTVDLVAAREVAIELGWDWRTIKASLMVLASCVTEPAASFIFVESAAIFAVFSTNLVKATL